METNLFCFGLGYVAKKLANSLNIQNITGTHTGKREFREGEYLLNDSSDFNLANLDDITHILISIPPTEVGDMVYLRFFDYIKELKKLRWIGYLSSTSVYGDHQGLWVTENSSTDSLDYFGKNRLIAEKQWLESGLPINILRIAGIYGPGRSVIENAKLGKAVRIFKKEHYFSRINIQDLVTMLEAIINNPKIGEIYNIADDLPAPQHEIIAFVCELMNLEVPTMIDFEHAELSEAMGQYYKSSKRVSNAKIKKDYKIKLKFPSYKEGLRDLLVNYK